MDTKNPPNTSTPTSKETTPSKTSSTKKTDPLARFSKVFAFPDNPMFLSVKHWNLTTVHDRVHHERLLDAVLPNPGDKYGILYFLGLEDKMIRRVLKVYEQEYNGSPGAPEPPFIRRGADGLWFQYALSDKLDELYSDLLDEICTSEGWKLEEDVTWEDYYQRGLKMGLRPDHAAKVGVHETDIRYESAGSWQRTNPVVRCQREVKEWLLRLQNLWREQREYRLEKEKMLLQKEVDTASKKSSWWNFGGT